MTLQTLYSLRIFFRLLRMAAIFFGAIYSTGVAIGIYQWNFNREFVFYVVWFSLCALLVILSTDAIRFISVKISEKLRQSALD